MKELCVDPAKEAVCRLNNTGIYSLVKMDTPESKNTRIDSQDRHNWVAGRPGWPPGCNGACHRLYDVCGSITTVLHSKNY